MFWFDSWTDLGPLIKYVGEAGPLQMRVWMLATVSEATRNGHWNIPHARSLQSETLQIELTTIPVPAENMGDDKFLWIQGNGTFGASFSSKITWEHIRVPAPVQNWHKVIWYKEYIPRNSFISWLALLRRLPTRDRLRGWGLNVPEHCVLCSTGIETHHHLFFECAFSASVWSHIAGSVWQNPPQDIHSAAA